MKRNTLILNTQLLVMVVGFASPILAMLMGTKGEHYALGCTICMMNTFWLYLLEQYKK